MSDIRRRLMEAFEAEYREHLEVVRAWLDGLGDAGPGAAARGIEEPRRRVHSLKGAARAVEMPAVEALAHELESLFGTFGRNEADPGGGALELIGAALDAVEDCVAAYRSGGSVPDTAGLRGRIASLTGEEAPQPVPIEVRPAAKEAPASGPSSPPPTPDSAGGSARVDVATLDKLLETVGEVGADVERMTGITASLEKCLRIGERLEHLDSSPGVDRYREQVSELLAALRPAVAQHAAAAWQQKQSAARLRKRAGDARMVTVESLFGGARKSVRDLARETGRTVAVTVSGLNTVADRHVLQALTDPVSHMLRNAVSHGIEPPEERRRAGKAAEGRVALTFRSDNARLTITVEDDGRGLDAAALAEKAVAAGLSPTSTADLSRERLLELICNAGLSTAGELSHVAGRGIGMSVVQQAVNALQGTLSVESGADGGTRFRLVVPVSTASTRVVLVRAGEHTFALPSRAVRRVVWIEPEALYEEAGQSMLVLDDVDTPVPVTRLSRWFGVAADGPAAGARCWGLLTGGGGPRCILVDSIVAVRDEVVSRIPPPGDRVPFVVGAVRLEGGGAAPCLAVQAIGPESAAAPRPAAGREAKPMPHILVVDDSITTRTLERSILEAHDYPVSVCVDGLEALDVLRGTAVDLVIADVEMPRMNGFELLQEMKNDRQLSSIPVIMVTSLGSDADRRRGLELGADAYLVKKTFDQTELLEMIGRFT